MFDGIEISQVSDGLKNEIKVIEQREKDIYLSSQSRLESQSRINQSAVIYFSFEKAITWSSRKKYKSSKCQGIDSAKPEVTVMMPKTTEPFFQPYLMFNLHTFMSTSLCFMFKQSVSLTKKNKVVFFFGFLVFMFALFSTST